MPTFEERHARRAVQCPVEVSRTVWGTPSRPPEACAPTPVVPALDYITPTPQDEADVQLPLPQPLSLQNARFSLRCADVAGAGPHGVDSVVEAGSVGRSFYWNDVPDITRTQLAFIAGLSGDDIEYISISDNIGHRARLTDSQAAFVESALAQFLVEIDNEVYNAALSGLNCVWRSAEKTASCPEVGHLLNTESVAGDQAGVRNPSVVPAGFAESSNSQSEADAIAQAEAEARLVCLFANAPLTLTCQDIGYADEVVTDDPEGEPATRDGRYRVGSATVPAGSYFSTLTQEAADEAARAAATAVLSCFYVNTERLVACPAGGFFSEPVDYDLQIPGNPIVVQPGRFVADAPGSGQADADANAEAGAAAFLRCVFRNTEQTVTCPSITLEGNVLDPASDSVIVVPAGEYEGTTQAEADELARQSALLQLGCTYCNAFIPPSCYPNTFTPEPGKAIPLSAVDSTWSSDVILGLAAGVICNPDPAEAQTVAEVIANQPVSPQQLVPGCNYDNDELWVGCLPDLEGSPALPAGGYHAPSYASVPLPEVFADLPIAQQLSPFSSPSPLSAAPYIVIPAGSQPINSRDVPEGKTPKDYANEVAALYGLALLDCFFATPAMDMTCAEAYEGRFVQEDLATGSGQRTITRLEAGAGVSYASFADAYLNARLIAQGVLDCYYESPETRVSCWETQSVQGSLPALFSDVGGVYKYGSGRARVTTTVEDVSTDTDVALQPNQLGSLSKPAVLPRGAEISLLSKQDAADRALVAAASLLDCTSQVLVSLLPVCSERMIVKCGGLIEPNGAAPYVAGTNQSAETWERIDGVLHVGDGHNRVMSQNGVRDGPWEVTDLGCSTDPVGGCDGDGLELPVCFEQGRDQAEANRRAYMSGRAMLTCEGPEVGPVDSYPQDGQDGAPGPPGNDAPQTNCESTCLAVYS